MSVNTIHPQLSNLLSAYELCRDAIAGDDAIKSKKDKYVPRLSGQTEDEYKAYLTRPSYENYIQRTLDGFNGLIFAKNPIIEYPKQMESIINDTDLDGSTFTDLAQSVVSETLSISRVGLLVDMAKTDTNGLKAIDIERLNIRPYVKLYTSESIINWRYETINNIKTTTLIVLQESEEVWSEFDFETQNIYRVLRLKDGIYTQQIYRESDDKKSFYSNEDDFYIPLMNGKALSYIPFISITPENLTLTPTKPAIYDLAKLNISYFRFDVDLSHAIHFTALPTPFIFGAMIKDTEVVSLGSTDIKVFDNPQGHAEFLEFKGDGVQTIERKMDRIKNSMSVIGAKFIESTKKAAETNETLQSRTSGERAVLISLADTVSRGLTQALEICAEWMGISQEVKVTLNSDFNLNTIDPAMLKVLNESRSLGFITPQIYFKNLLEGEIIEEGTSYEDYATELEEAAPQLSVTPQQTTNADNTSLLSSLKSKLGI